MRVEYTVLPHSVPSGRIHLDPDLLTPHSLDSQLDQG